MDLGGNIVQWDARRWAVSNKKDGPFYWLTQDIEESGIEYSSSFIADNNYSFVKVGTTADEVKVGVSPDRRTGVYVYYDHGSGNGYNQLSLICKKL